MKERDSSVSVLCTVNEMIIGGCVDGSVWLWISGEDEGGSHFHESNWTAPLIPIGVGKGCCSGLIDRDAGLDLVDVDGELFVEFAAGMGVRASGLSVAALVVALLVEVLLELFVAEWRRQVVVLEPGVEAAADLLDGQLLSATGVEVLADAAAEEEAQAGDGIMSVNAVPAADLEVVESEFFFGESEAGFDGPATEGNAEQATECDAVLADDAVGEKVYNLSGADAAGNDYSVTQAGEVITGVSPDGNVFILPETGPLCVSLIK